MEAGFIALLVVMTMIGVLAGMFIEKVNTKKSDDRAVVGTLNAVYDSPDCSPDLFLALEVPIEDAVSQRLAVFRVNTIRDNSHE